MKDLLCGQKWTFCCGTSVGKTEEAGRQSEERIHWYFAHFWIQQWWPSLPFPVFFPFFFFFLLLSNFAPHSTIWMLVFLQGVRLVSSKQTPMYCKVNFQYKNIASKCLIWLSRVHFRKKKMSMIPDGYVFHPIASWCPYFQWVCHTDCTDQSDLKLPVYVVNPLLDGYEQGWNTCNWLSPSVISVLTDSSPYLHVIL